MVVAHGDRFAVNLGSAERAMVTRLLGELRALLTDTTDTSAQRALSRLFPVVHPESAELEEEYQRLMRDELIASRVAGIERVEELIGNGAPTVDDEPDGALLLDDDQLAALMRSVNSVRLVLGTILDVDEDDTVPDDADALAPEYQLYAFLSWLLDSAVLALSPEPD